MFFKEGGVGKGGGGGGGGKLHKCPFTAAAEPGGGGGGGVGGGIYPPQLYRVKLLLAVTNRVVHYNQRERKSDDIKSVNR